MEPNFAALENLFLALSDGTRLRLLALMADGEVSVGFLADQLGESQPKVSRHLAYLRGAGLVSTRRDGKWIYYGIETQQDPSANEVLDTALAAMNGNRADGQARQNATYAVPQPQQTINTYDHADMSDWTPTELDIFLL